MEIIQSPLGEKVRDLFGLAVVLSPKIGLKRIKDDYQGFTPAILQVHPHGYSPAGLVRTSNPSSSWWAKAIQLSRLLEPLVGHGAGLCKYALVKNSNRNIIL